MRVRSIAFFLVGFAVVMSGLLYPSAAGLHLVAMIFTFLIVLAFAANKDFGGVALAAGLILGVCVLIPVMIMSIGIGMLSG